MPLSRLLRRCVSMPPHRLAAKATRRAWRVCQAHAEQRRDELKPTFAPWGSVPATPLHRFFRPLAREFLEPRRASISQFAELVCDHRFNLLGSGWTRVVHGLNCPGLEGCRYPPADPVTADNEGRWLVGRLNPANVDRARHVWRLIDGAYVPIDWQLDFKSGFRWSELTWSKHIRYGDAGADVKVPWELARMQHLVQFAWAWALSADRSVKPLNCSQPEGNSAEVHSREFRNQVLDFIAANPPRFGVNWSCTMDVAIRVVNWLVAYDLFRAFARFDDGFETVFRHSVYDHGRHIAQHLEWDSTLRANHYLADVAGLLFVAAYLPATTETDRWLDFAVREFVHETGLQFHADGTNFEASTAYHRLSAEMVVYATALVLALPEERVATLQAGVQRGRKFHPDPQAPPLEFQQSADWPRLTAFPSSHFERLRGMAEFTMASTRPDGRVCQFGDNDSGRFLKVWPAWIQVGSEPDDLREDSLDHRHLVAAVNGLCPRQDFEAFAGEFSVETWLIRELTNSDDRRRTGGTALDAVGTATRDRETACRRVGPGEAAPVSTTDCGWSRVFADFGLYVFRRDRLYLAFRCGSVGQKGNGGHAHNDQLSFELCCDRVPTVVDAGTGLYTPFPDVRNRFRSTAMHNTLSVARSEQNAWEPGPAGLFVLRDRARIRILRHTPDEIVAEHRGFGFVHRRMLRLHDAGIDGLDECAAAGQKTIRFHLPPGAQPHLSSDCRRVVVTAQNVNVSLAANQGAWSVAETMVSPGYGEFVPARVCSLGFEGDSIAWRIVLESPAQARQPV